MVAALFSVPGGDSSISRSSSLPSLSSVASASTPPPSAKTVKPARANLQRASSMSPASISMDSREKEEILAAARKKLKNYRKTKQSKRLSSVNGAGPNSSISSLRSLGAGSLSSSSSLASLSVVSTSPTTPSALVGRPVGGHHKKRSSLGGSRSSMGAFRMPLGTAASNGSVGSSAGSSPGMNAMASGSRSQQQHGHESSLSVTGRHGHKRSMSTKFTFPPPSSSPAIGPPPAGRKARPVSMGYGPSVGSRGFSFPSPHLPPSSPGPPPIPTSVSVKRHSHRRSLSVSTKHGSLSLLLPPDVAAKLAASPGPTVPPASAADERRRALEALSGRRTSQLPTPSTSTGPTTEGRPLSGLGVSGWDTGLMPSVGTVTADLSEGRVVLPDFGSLAEDESFEHEPPQSAFGFSTAQVPGPSGRGQGYSKRDSFGKLMPSSGGGGYLSLPSLLPSMSSSPASSPNFSQPASFGSSNGMPSVLSSLNGNSQGLATATPPVVSSPRFGPDGFPLGLGGIAEEEESDEDTPSATTATAGEKAVRRASQQVSLPPSRFGRFTGNNSPRLPASIGASVGWGWQAPSSPAAPAAASAPGVMDGTGRSVSGGHGEEDRMRAFSFGGGNRVPSSPLAGVAFTKPATATPEEDDAPATFAGPAPTLGDEKENSPQGPAAPQDESTRFRAFAFPHGPVIAPTAPPPALVGAESSPLAESASEWETLVEDGSADLEKTPNPPQAATFAPPPSIVSPPRSAKKVLRPLTLASISPKVANVGMASPPSSRRAGLRPLSLSIVSSASSTPNRANSTFGSDSSFSAGSPPPTMSPAGGQGRYGNLGYRRPSASGGSRSNLSLSSSTSSVNSAASSFTALGGRSNSVSWTPSPGRAQANGEKRRSSISYGKSPSPSPAAATPPSVGGGKRSLAKCPITTRPLSFISASSSSRRMLADVGEDQEEQLSASVAPVDDDDGRSLTSPFSHEDDPFLHRQPFSLIAGGPDSTPSEEGDGELPSIAASSPVASAEEQRLRQQLESVESERDALVEDVDGWRSRCKLLEEKLAEEKRIAIVERDLSRERIRKLGDRLASLTPNENTSAEHLTAQTRLVTEMRDQIFSLASSLARSEEMRKQAEESLRDELDERERRIAEAVDEDRRSRQAILVTAQPAIAAIAPPTPPLLSGSNSSVSSNVSTNRSSFGPGQQQAAAVRVSSDDDNISSLAAGGYDSWKASPWGAGGAVMQPTGDIEGFGVVPPRPLEALVEEADEEEAHPDDRRSFHAPLEFAHQSFSSSAYDISDDNAALGLDSSGDFDPDGFDEDVPHNFLSPRPSDEHFDVDADEPKTPVPPGLQPDLIAPDSTLTPRTAPVVDDSASRHIFAPQSQPPLIQEPPKQHSKRHSLQRTWVMPRGPVVASPEEPQGELATPTASARFSGDDEDEDVKPFGTWVVPPSPFCSTETDDSSRFVSNAFPSALATPIFPSALGYNDPPAALLNQRAHSVANRPNTGNRSVSAPLPSGRGGAPPVSRSAVYHAANPSIGSIASSAVTGMTESTSMFSLTSLTSTIGSYVLPPKGGGPAGVLCSVIPEDDGQTSGQWVVRAHDSLLSASTGSGGRPSLSSLQNGGGSTLTRSGSSASFRAPQSSASRRASKAYVDPRNQPPPYASPVGLLDFRQTCCGDDWSGIIEL